jgi:pantetheine-phosphate adenylyltransferase
LTAGGRLWNAENGKNSIFLGDFLLTKVAFSDIDTSNLVEIVRTVPWMENRAVYPGFFDPITNGHVDIILRGLRLFDRIIIAVLKNPKKSALFSTKDRVAMIQEIFAAEPKVEVKSFDGLLVDFAKKNKANVVIRGLRAVSDFEYELQMALMNRKLNPEVETLYMMPSVNYSFLSSHVVKEVFSLGGCIKGLVPEVVEKKLKDKFRKGKFFISN